MAWNGMPNFFSNWILNGKLTKLNKYSHDTLFWMQNEKKNERVVLKENMISSRTLFSARDVIIWGKYHLKKATQQTTTTFNAHSLSWSRIEHYHHHHRHFTGRSFIRNAIGFRVLWKSTNQHFFLSFKWSRWNLSKETMLLNWHMKIRETYVFSVIRVI